MHDLGDQFDGLLKDFVDVPRIGQHHGDVVNGRQFVDPLAKLEFLITKPGDGVRQEIKELNGGGVAGAGPQKLPRDLPHLL